jgi:formylmethanofuran dehydrogenase subunit B
MQRRYAVVVHDAEPTAQPRNVLRAEALLALTEALNGPTRAALCSLRAGGNQVGVEAVLTTQTGYPLAVDYSRGYPRYTPAERPVGLLREGGFRTVLVAGSPSFDPATMASLSTVSTILVGPRASRLELKSVVAVDTGVAGIHEEGTAYRMDEVPLRLRPPLQTPHQTPAVLRSLAEAIQVALRGRRG